MNDLNSTSSLDAIVIGGGAAGLFCAATAGALGQRVLVLEHNDRVGKKIGISGGGRCNFTNLNAGPENYLSAQPNFCRSALARYTPGDFLALVEKHGIGYHEKTLGQQFCNTSSRAIIALLEKECRDARVEVRCQCRIERVERTEAPAGFTVWTSQGRFTAPNLIVATGGLSFAKLGATGFAYDLARQFGIKVTSLRPGLVPLTLPAADELGALSGLALPVRIRHGRADFSEALLFTHRGISGPVVLQVSSFWREGEPLAIDLLPDSAGPLLDRDSRAAAVSQLARHWPNRFAEVWAARHVPEKPCAHLKNRELEQLATLAHAWPLRPSGTEGYPKAEVTLGGIDTSELSSQTLESRRVPGLYFIGEAVDVTGWLGGYNFQWAWACAHAAGEALSRKR